HRNRVLRAHRRRNQRHAVPSAGRTPLRLLRSTARTYCGIRTRQAGPRHCGSAVHPDGGSAMLAALQAYYLAASTALFLYAIYTPRRALRAFLIGIGLNIFPLAALPYMNMDVARFGSMPLVYLPMTAVGLAIILRNGFAFPKRFRPLYALIAVFLVYIFCNTILARGFSVSNLVYWLAWPLNFLMFIATASLVARMNPAFVARLLDRVVMLLVAASLVGLARFASGFEPDANFIPLMNRNG